MAQMISPLDKRAPRFNGHQPEYLCRFFDNMETIFDKENITTDREKKNLVVYFTDPFTENEWRAMETFESRATWEEFRKEITESYPEAMEWRDGSSGCLQEICLTHQSIKIQELTRFLGFKRAFRGEAR